MISLPQWLESLGASKVQGSGSPGWVSFLTLTGVAHRNHKAACAMGFMVKGYMGLYKGYIGSGDSSINRLPRQQLVVPTMPI